MKSIIIFIVGLLSSILLLEFVRADDINPVDQIPVIPYAEMAKKHFDAGRTFDTIYKDTFGDSKFKVSSTAAIRFHATKMIEHILEAVNDPMRQVPDMRSFLSYMENVIAAQLRSRDEKIGWKQRRATIEIMSSVFYKNTMKAYSLSDIKDIMKEPENLPAYCPEIYLAQLQARLAFYGFKTEYNLDLNKDTVHHPGRLYVYWADDPATMFNNKSDINRWAITLFDQDQEQLDKWNNQYNNNRDPNKNKDKKDSKKK